MTRTWTCRVLAGLFLAICAYGATYREGKTVMEKEYKVDVVKMQWGIVDTATDRILGTARLYVKPSEAYSDVTLTFDVFSRKAVSNATPVVASTGQRIAPTAEKIDTIDCTFNFHKYGFKTTRLYIEGEFCVDIPKNPDASRLQLASVKFGGSVVNYQTSFNITSSLLKTLFKIPEPKVTTQTGTATRP